MISNRLVPSLLAAVLLTTIVLPTAFATAQEATKPVERVGAPYLLQTCAVNGRALPADGGTVLVFDGGGDRRQAGREFRFCCPRCRATFEKEPGKYIKSVDDRIVADQLPRYPKDAPCLVMADETLPDPTGPDARDCKIVVSHNRLVRLCCGKCVRMFERNPAKYLEALDAAVIAEARRRGTIRTCAVNGRPLTERAVWFVVGDRPMAASCGNCRKKVEADPWRFVMASDTPKKDG